MKTILVLITIIFSSSLKAQSVSDTLYANNKKNVALFFPEAIRQGITGASHFVFTYNRETKQYFGLLQAQPGEVSNLLVVTEDGQVYSYILKYVEQLPKLNYFISKAESIGSEVPLSAEPKPKQKRLDSIEKNFEYFKSFSTYLLKTKPKRIAAKQKNGIKIQLQKMIYHKSEIYLVMEVFNTSGITFETDFLKVYSVSGNKKRKSSYQRLEMKPIYICNHPNKIWNGQSLRFVYVLPKFVLGDKEKLLMELQELNGSRKVTLSTRL
ncbi:hypothetical protein JoomaDRAFT_1689 [Galbibacter orientalis DSM 19592]|uniref:Conjugal transfer protein n=1 Tax=Galbibacter orientalis DSM 19592 TaxID=926559 RepID=I3C506_9FLAO|nr:DUF4138 domain-containing protein [Galbibacter orientalis]EIJ38699.1 hypothetical protein JoomaDRAFT_1689 [Galbibacter orientalis DSM 19592]